MAVIGLWGKKMSAGKIVFNVTDTPIAVGPGASVDKQLAYFDSTVGYLLKAADTKFVTTGLEIGGSANLAILARSNTALDIGNIGGAMDTVFCWLGGSGNWWHYGHMNPYFVGQRLGTNDTGYLNKWAELNLGNGITDGGTIRFCDGFTSILTRMLKSDNNGNLGITGFTSIKLDSSQIVRRTSATLAACIAVANELRTRMLAHAASSGAGAAHVNADGVSFVGMPAAAVDLTTLKALVAFELTSYAAHNADAELGAAWLYHAAQNAAPHTLASVVAPVTLALCVTRLADLKAKYSAGHDADATSHTTASLFPSIVDLYGYSTLRNDYIVAVENTSKVVTITLSTADVAEGRYIIVKDESGGAATKNITIDTEGAETVDGGPSASISSNYGSVRLYSNGIDWFTV